MRHCFFVFFFFFQAEDGIRDHCVTGVQTCALPICEGAVLDSTDEGEVLLPDLARQMMRRLVEPTRTRARLFDKTGKLIADSRLLRGPGDAVQVAELPTQTNKGLLARLVDWIYDGIEELLPRRGKHPVYREGETA